MGRARGAGGALVAGEEKIEGTQNAAQNAARERFVIDNTYVGDGAFSSEYDGKHGAFGEFPSRRRREGGGGEGSVEPNPTRICRGLTRGST